MSSKSDIIKKINRIIDDINDDLEELDNGGSRIRQQLNEIKSTKEDVQSMAKAILDFANDQQLNQLYEQLDQLLILSSQLNLNTEPLQEIDELLEDRQDDIRHDKNEIREFTTLETSDYKQAKSDLKELFNTKSSIWDDNNKKIVDLINEFDNQVDAITEKRTESSADRIDQLEDLVKRMSLRIDDLEEKVDQLSSRSSRR